LNPPVSKINVEDLPIIPEIKQALLEKGIVTLFPPQIEAIKAGVLKGYNLVVSAPTASGKTLIAEIAILNKVLKERVKALYLTHLRALASEKFEEFSFYEKSLGLKIALTTGDYDSSDPWLEDYDIIITTNEKADSLLRHRAEWLKRVGIVVADEIHLINEPKRGPTLEIVLSRLLGTVENLQVLALSATIGNAGEIAEWLNAKLVVSKWRPVELREGVFLDWVIHYSDGTLTPVSKIGDEIASLTIDSIKGGGQVLIFTSTRQRAVSLARRLAPVVHKLLTSEEKSSLIKISKDLIRSERNYLTENLSIFMKGGVAFHHAGLSYGSRKLIEENFRKHLLKAVVATPTLAAGVNLPARRVVISDYRRYNSELGMHEEIPVMEYKQMCLPYDALVLTEEGEKAIGEVVEEESDVQVYSMDPLRRKVVLSPVSKKYVRRTSTILEISLENGFVLRITPEHEVAVIDNGHTIPLKYIWLQAKYLKPGDLLIFLDPKNFALKPLIVTKATVKTLQHPIKVFNLSVYGTENYFVGGILVHNCGRAGRPKYDDHGEAIAIARNEREKDFIFEFYVYSEPEEISSKLSSEPSLRSQVLALVSTESIHSMDELLAFLGKTFYAYQYPLEAIRFHVKRILRFLHEYNFVSLDEEGHLEATLLGRRVSELYIDPYTAALLAEGIKRIEPQAVEFKYLHLITQAPEIPIYYLRRGENKKLEAWIKDHPSWILSLTDIPLSESDYELYLARLKTALILHEWINEVDENSILEKYDIGPGDLYHLIQTAEWLLYSACELAKITGHFGHIQTLLKLRERVKHGVREELLELTRIKGIGRKRARILYNHGIRTIRDLARTPPTKLLSLPLMGKEIVRKIYESLELNSKPLEKISEEKKEPLTGTLDDFL